MAASAAAGVPPDLRNRPLPSLREADAPEVQRRLCGGQVLLRIRLAGDEVASLKEPEPLFTMVPRVAYLPFLFNDAMEHFKACLMPRMGEAYELWFDYNNVALKWHYPVGVLCDLLVGQSVPVPLDLTVHFQGCAWSKELLPFNGMADLQKSVMNAFREAAFLEHGSSSPFMRLSKLHQTSLWDAISRSDWKAFAQVQAQLLCGSLGKCKSLALRLHLWAQPATHCTLLHRAPPLQEGSDAPCRLRDYLAAAIPPLLGEDGELVEGVELLVHGLTVPLETPIYWLALHAGYLDNFVHLVVRMPTEMLQGASSFAS